MQKYFSIYYLKVNIQFIILFYNAIEVEENMEKNRTLCTIIGLPIVGIILTLGNQYIVDMLLAIVSVIAIKEYYNAISRKAKPVKWLGYLLCIFIAIIHILPESSLPTIALISIPTIMLILFLQVIFTNMKTNFNDIVYTFFGIFYIILSIGFLSLITGLENGRVLIWYVIIASWGTDIFAYLIGKRFGKHKFSSISPKKSIEGCIAGIMGAVVISQIYTGIINSIGFKYSYINILVLTSILSIISQIGDFAASTIKRYIGIKDYSNLIPGHGGILDRIDSLMFIAPFAYFILGIL